MCIAAAANFLCDSRLTGMVDSLTDAVRKGGTAMPDGGTTTPENDIWVQFAESMAPMMAMTAGALASALGEIAAGARKVLDIAAGHGMFGITLAQRNPQMRMVGLDWARFWKWRSGMHTRLVWRIDILRFRVVLLMWILDRGTIWCLPNFLHHFRSEVNVELLKKVHGALAVRGAGGDRGVCAE